MEKGIKKSLWKNQTGDKIFAIALLIPAIITTVSFILVPVVDSIYRSFFDYKVRNIISGQPGVWNNFANYTKLFSNGKLIPSMTNTLTFVFGVVIAQFVLGMALALILNSNVKFSRFIRSIMMVPWVVPTLISGLVWLWMFQPQYGLVKYFVGVLTKGRITDFAILNNPATAMFGVSVAALWKQIPLATLLLLAGLANVPEDMQEAVQVCAVYADCPSLHEERYQGYGIHVHHREFQTVPAVLDHDRGRSKQLYDYDGDLKLPGGVRLQQLRIRSCSYDRLDADDDCCSLYL